MHIKLKRVTCVTHYHCNKLKRPMTMVFILHVIELGF